VQHCVQQRLNLALLNIDFHFLQYSLPTFSLRTMKFHSTIKILAFLNLGCEYVQMYLLNHRRVKEGMFKTTV